MDSTRLTAAFTANSIEALTQYVTTGLGVTFLSKFAVEHAVRWTAIFDGCAGLTRLRAPNCDF